MAVLDIQQAPRRRFDRGGPSASGHRLVEAFTALERFPALSHSRDRLARLLPDEQPDTRQVVSVVESDPALTLAVLAADRKVRGPAAIGSTVQSAVQALPLENLRRIASRVPVFDFFDNSREAGEDAERFRLHALATQRAAERVRQEVGAGSRDDIAIAALLHDVGKIVLLAAYDRYREIAFVRGTPEQRLLLERRELGIDHVMAGGVLARRLGLPDQLVAAITGHHADERGPDAAVVRVADMLVHHQSGQPIDRPALKRAARTLGLSDEALNSLHYDLTQPPAGGPRESDPSPLSERQHAVLKLLAEGKLYKQIALELGLSTSTVRSHLNNTYAKLDVTDRAQAVLRAAERGWL